MIKKEWFSSWFDSEEYHILYNNRNNEEAKVFIKNLMRYLNLPISSTILDLGCGKGRHSKTLSELGYNVTGADLSPASIAHANQFSNERLKFIVHDMRDLLPHEHFDCVANLFTSFGYFEKIEENIQVLNNIHTMLNDQGILIIDFMNAIKTQRELIPNEVKHIQGREFKINRYVEQGVIVKDIQINYDNRSVSHQERVQLFDKSQFEQMLLGCGFSIMTTFGNFELDPFVPETSDRLIIIARKK